MKKYFVLIIIILFVGTSVLPSISGNIYESRNIEIVNNVEHSPLQVTFTRPENGIYCFDNKILPFPVPLILCGKITIEAEIEPLSEVCRIEYYLNDFLHKEIVKPPWLLIWSWGGTPFSKIKFGIIAYTLDGNQAGDEITTWFLFG